MGQDSPIFDDVKHLLNDIVGGIKYCVENTAHCLTCTDPDHLGEIKQLHVVYGHHKHDYKPHRVRFSEVNSEHSFHDYMDKVFHRKQGHYKPPHLHTVDPKIVTKDQHFFRTMYVSE
jgi:hypothetical protein